MSMQVQPLPWNALPNREIADANNNVVQYTHGTLGYICLCVNAYPRLVGALMAVEQELQKPIPLAGWGELIASVKLALGKIGGEQVAAMIEALDAPSGDVDRAIAQQFGLPEAPYTSSTDAAMSLAPVGWSMAMSASGGIHPITGEQVMTLVIELKGPNGEIATGRNVHIARAWAAAGTRARDMGSA